MVFDTVIRNVKGNNIGITWDNRLVVSTLNGIGAGVLGLRIKCSEPIERCTQFTLDMGYKTRSIAVLCDSWISIMTRISVMGLSGR